MTLTNNPLLARFDGKPFLVSSEMQTVFEACLSQASIMLERIQSDTSKPRMDVDGDEFWYAKDDWRSAYRPYIVKNGVLQIPVKGVLLHDFPYQLGSWATGYDYIWRAFQRGMGDYNVKGIALVEDSPGGEVAGNFDMVDKMFAMRGKKPVRAYAMESAYSAAYSVASVADTITVSRTGGVGSIGVVTAHVDYSKAMDERGVKVTFIQYGKHKTDGNQYQPLPDDVKSRIQERIDELGQVFVATVARNRGMDEQAIRDTEARTFTATQAVSNGLADAIGSFEDAIAAFAADLSLEDEDEKMSDEEKAALAQAAKTEGVNEGKATGASEERERIRAIVNSDAGKARPATALKMALNDKFASVEASAVVEMLADLPEEKAAAATPDAPKGKEGAAADFNAAMNKSDNPNVGAESEATADEKRSARIKAAAAAAGRLVKAK